MRAVTNCTPWHCTEYLVPQSANVMALGVYVPHICSAECRCNAFPDCSPVLVGVPSQKIRP